MTAPAAPVAARPGDRLGTWCGWVLIGGAALTPLVAWLAPLGFAPLLTVIGLLCLPALRLSDEDRPGLIVLLAALVWAAVSTTWSPFHPKNAGTNSALKLALELPLYFSAICGARRATSFQRARAASVLAWGLALLGLLLISESLTDGVVFRTLHNRFYEPITTDLAEVKIAETTFVTALLWPVALVGRIGRPRDAWLLAPTVLGTVLAAHQFRGDAPVLAAPIAGLVIGAAWLWPRIAPRVVAAGAAILFLIMPAIIALLRVSGVYDSTERAVPLSWGWRMGYWSHAADWISDHPFRGWGLDASRAMGPGIQLHPHNGALQVWLELGMVGACAAAAFWALTLLRLSRPQPSLAQGAALGSAAVYLLFGGLNFGIWQEWWLALGAYVAVLAATVAPKLEQRSST